MTDDHLIDRRAPPRPANISSTDEHLIDRRTSQVRSRWFDESNSDISSGEEEEVLPLPAPGSGWRAFGAARGFYSCAACSNVIGLRRDGHTCLNQRVGCVRVTTTFRGMPLRSLRGRADGPAGARRFSSHPELRRTRRLPHGRDAFSRRVIFFSPNHWHRVAKTRRSAYHDARPDRGGALTRFFRITARGAVAIAAPVPSAAAAAPRAAARRGARRAPFASGVGSGVATILQEHVAAAAAARALAPYAATQLSAAPLTWPSPLLVAALARRLPAGDLAPPAPTPDWWPPAPSPRDIDATRALARLSAVARAAPAPPARSRRSSRAAAAAVLARSFSPLPPKKARLADAGRTARIVSEL